MVPAATVSKVSRDTACFLNTDKILSFVLLSPNGKTLNTSVRLQCFSW